MKLKKLLAGVLSATMVATMIPASMAFSVSAEAEGGLVAAYDLTTEAGRSDWTNASIGTVSITTDSEGVHSSYGWTEETGLQADAYSIVNPLAGNVTDGFTVVVNTTGGFANPGTSLFGFSDSVNPYDNDVNTSYTRTGCFTVMTDMKSMHLNPWDGVENGWWDIAYEDPAVQTSGGQYVLTGNADGGVALYLNGTLMASYANTSEIVAASNHGEASWIKTVAHWVNTKAYFNLGASTYWLNEAQTYTSVAFYNEEMSADQVAAMSIADSLNLEVVGMQNGATTDGTDAIRFVANVDQSVVGNEAIANLGWAFEVGAQQLSNYKTPAVSTVSDEAALCVNENSYAFTMMFKADGDVTAENYAVAPYVSVVVKGNTYNFCYNGRYGNFETTNSSNNIVYVPVDFAVAGA